jgi:hypothetical protein
MEGIGGATYGRRASGSYMGPLTLLVKSPPLPYPQDGHNLCGIFSLASALYCLGAFDAARFYEQHLNTQNTACAASYKENIPRLAV